MKRSNRFCRLCCRQFGAAPLITFLTLLFMAVAARGQDRAPRDIALWFDYDPTWPLSGRLTLDVDVASRFVNSDPALWQMRLYPTLTFDPWKWLDLTGGVWFIYTNRFENSDRFETRPFVGIKLKKDIWRGIRLSDYLREEFRIQRDLDTGETASARRLRNRIQAMIPINHRSLSQDNTWYAFVDAEWFFQKAALVDDGFNGRRRYRAGIAWRKNSTWTYQFFYGFQRTSANVRAPFSNIDIFSFSLIQTFK